MEKALNEQYEVDVDKQATELGATTAELISATKKKQEEDKAYWEGVMNSMRELDKWEAEQERIANEREREKELQAKIKMQIATLQNAEQEAEYRKIAKALNKPIWYVRENYEQAKMLSTDTSYVERSKKVRDFLNIPDMVDIAHDDVENLSAMASITEGVTNAGKATVKGAAKSGQDLLVGGAALLNGWVGENFDTPIRFLFGDNPFLRNEAGFRKMHATMRAGIEQILPTPQSAIYSAFESVGYMVPSLTVGFLTGGATLGASASTTAMANTATALMGAGVASSSYLDARDRGLSANQALIYGLGQGGIEIATERIPAKVFFKNIQVGSPFYKSIINQLSSEIPSEQVATIFQDLNEWATLNPEKPFSEYLAERPEAAYNTLVSTVVATGVMGGAGHVIGRVIHKNEQKHQSANKTIVMANAIHEMSKVAVDSKLRTRDPEAFKDYVASLFGDTDVQEVYISGELLQQSGIAQDLVKENPEFAEKLNLAISTGQDVKIPITDYVTHVATHENAEQLAEHIKIDPDGMTVKEAKEYLPKAEEELKASIDRAIEADNQERVRLVNESAQRLEAKLTDQITATGVYTPDVAKAQVAPIVSMYKATAERLGITPEELFERHPVQIQAGVVNTAGYEQALKNSPPQGWVHVDRNDRSAVASLWQGNSSSNAVFWTDEGGKLGDLIPSLKGYSVSIDRSAVKHIKKKHGDSESEQSRGQVAITEKDIAIIPEIVRDFDDIQFSDIPGTHTKRIAFSKKVDDGVLVYIADSSKKKQDLRTVTMWKYPSTANAHKVLQHAVPLLNLTSETKEGISHITEDVSSNNSESQYYQGDINTVESTSFTETANKYGGKQAYEQAKSQGKTELTYEQWVQVRTPEFKAWFGNWEKPNKKTSKVVNPRTGEPLVVYHGTGHAPFDTFTMDFMGKNGTADGRGHYFTSDPNFANLYTSENGHVFSVFLNVPTV
ncbi:hypothetical protein, partial [Basilea psittacipulmonis]